MTPPGVSLELASFDPMLECLCNVFSSFTGTVEGVYVVPKYCFI